MKLATVLVAFIAVCASSTVPTIPGDNSHYGQGESRYIWMSDGDGIPQLVDLEEPILGSNDPMKNGANNQYWLYTRENPTTPQTLVFGDPNSIRNSNYKPANQLKVLVHGWNGSGNSVMNPTITSAYLAIADVNVIVVDWRAVANENYVSAVANVPSVGNYIGNFLIWLIATGGGSWDSVHLIGYSLGAHVVGNAGRTANGWPQRVTGLDPAGPLWWGSRNALTQTDGNYVEAIHTDGGLQGIFNNIGNADFYPNGGRNPQPGCGNSACSHARAVEFFAATVRFNHLVGRQCQNLDQAQNNACTGANLNMGNGIINKYGSGIFGLTTGTAWPY